MTPVESDIIRHALIQSRMGLPVVPHIAAEDMVTSFMHFPFEISGPFSCQISTPDLAGTAFTAAETLNSP
jgi:hypothetical protein